VILVEFLQKISMMRSHAMGRNTKYRRVRVAA